MIAELHNKLREPKRIECSQIVVRDLYNKPIAVICEHAPGHYFCKWFGEEGFHELLQLMGINEEPLVELGKESRS